MITGYVAFKLRLTGLASPVERRKIRTFTTAGVFGLLVALVGDAAGRERDHDGDRARWIGLRARDYGPGRRRAGDECHELAAPHVLPLVRGITCYHIAKENAVVVEATR